MREFDQLVMRALMGAYPAPSTVEEIGAEIEDGIQAEVVLEDFERRGLAHRSGALFWLSRAAHDAASLALRAEREQ